MNTVVSNKKFSSNKEAFYCHDDVFLIVENRPSYPEDELSVALMLMMDHHCPPIYFSWFEIGFIMLFIKEL
jgi:hypothetical protein